MFLQQGTLWKHHCVMANSGYSDNNSKLDYAKVLLYWDVQHYFEVYLNSGLFIKLL
jgi:hypothetical protein